MKRKTCGNIVDKEMTFGGREGQRRGK